MAIAIFLVLAVIACLVALAVAEQGMTKFWFFAAGVVFLCLLPLQAASITRGSVTEEAQTLSDCGLREGSIYTLESEVDHTDYRTLIVVRDDSDYSHRACILTVGSVPQRFVVTENRAVAVTDDNVPVGDTEYERRENERVREGAAYQGNFGQAQYEEAIVVTVPPQ